MNQYNIYYPSFDNLQRPNRKSAPILYVIASKRYQKGALTETFPNIPTSSDLWKEIINKKAIRKVLQDWIQSNELNINISKMAPFRITLHQLNRCKIGIIKKFSNNETSQTTSMNQFDENNNSKFFAFIWIPMLNTKTGFTQVQYQSLIDAFNQSNYICKPLNKDCIYVSGPKYNHTEFDIRNLAIKCNNLCNKNNTLQFTYTVVIHEMSVGDRDRNEANDDNKGIKPLAPEMKHHHLSVTEEDEHDAAMEAFTLDSMKEMQQITTEHKMASTINLGSVYNTNMLNNISEEYEQDIEDDIHEKNAHQSGKSYAFPQAQANYFEHPIPRNRQLSQIKINSIHASTVDSFRSFAFVWITPHAHKRLLNDNKYPQLMTLPSYAIMKTLHKEPTTSNLFGHGAQILYNVELMAYDNCWNDLDLVIDRKFDIYDCLLLTLQFMFLPIFMLFPIQYCLNSKKKNNMKPRYRPDNGTFEELDITEQIPYDVSILWKTNKCCGNKLLFQLISFIVSCFVYGIICCGPIFYHFRMFEYEENINIDNLNKLQFFDSYGLLLFYLLLVFTILMWSTHTRILIGPKQHILLYDKLFIQRPVSKQFRVTPRSDWGALVNLHEPMPITLFTYAHRKGFLQLEETPTNKLIDITLIKNCKFIILNSVAAILYLLAMNLENFEFARQPFYIGHENKYWLLLTIYDVFSSILQLIFLSVFICIWETMIWRTHCHFDNVRSLSHLIIKDTKTEYISLDNINNILSWLTLETFVKRKGMTLFSSVETPLLSLFILCFISWASMFYCIVQGVGLKLQTNDSMFSNSALITWLYLALLALLYTTRMILSGHYFYRETVKQSQAIKRQCRRENKNNLISFLNKDQLPIQQYLAQQSCELLLKHIEHSEIVPKVYGIQFDQLLAKAFITAAVSIVPTIASFIAARMEQPQQ